MKLSLRTPPKRYVPILIFSYLWSLFGNEVIFMELRWVPTEWEKVRSVSCTIVSDSLQSHGLQPTRVLCPWDSPGKNSGVGCHVLLQGIFPIQGLNLGLPHWRQILYCLSYKGSPDWIRVDPNPMTGVLVMNGKFEHWHRKGGISRQLGQRLE